MLNTTTSKGAYHNAGASSLDLAASAISRRPHGTSSSHITAEVSSLNSKKLLVVKNALQQSLGSPLFQFKAFKTSSGIDQPIGLKQTQQEALRRLPRNNKNIAKAEIIYSWSLVNGLVPGKELSEFFKKDYNKEHWYDLGVIALRVFKFGCQFTDMGYAIPLQIPNTEKEGFLPPDHSDKPEKNLLKYQAIILPLIGEGKDLYEIFSKGQLTRETAFSTCSNDSLLRLRAIQVYGFDSQISKIRTVITFGTFDHLHEMHKRLIRRGLNIGQELAVYVYGKNEKRKEGSVVKLSDSVQNRIEKVTRCALEVAGKSKVSVQRMQGKHLEALVQALKLHAKKGSTALVGGADQFEYYPEVLALCLEYGVPIITTTRGDDGSELCSSDIRRRESYARIRDIHDIDLTNCSPRFWKADFPTLKDAKTYIKDKMPLLGSDTTEIWKYNKSFIIDRKVVAPVFEPGKTIIILPGRTGCDIDRVRKVLTTIEDTLSLMPEDECHFYLTCYQETKETTEYYINELEQAPWDYFSDDAMIVTKLLLMPRVSKKISIEKKEDSWCVNIRGDFEKVPVDILKTIFLDITFWGRSRGAVIALEIENAFRFCLLALHYSDHEILEIGKQIGVFSISNLGSLERGRNFSTISVTGLNDKKALKYIKPFPERFSLQRAEGSDSKPHFLSSSHLAFFATIPQSIRTYMGKSNPADYYKEITVEDSDCHYTPLFLAHRINGDNTIPLLIKRVLKNMIFRSENFFLKQLTI